MQARERQTKLSETEERALFYVYLQLFRWNSSVIQGRMERGVQENIICAAENGGTHKIVLNKSKQCTLRGTANIIILEGQSYIVQIFNFAQKRLDCIITWRK